MHGGGFFGGQSLGFLPLAALAGEFSEIEDKAHASYSSGRYSLHALSQQASSHIREGTPTHELHSRVRLQLCSSRGLKQRLPRLRAYRLGL